MSLALFILRLPNSDRVINQIIQLKMYVILNECFAHNILFYKGVTTATLVKHVTQ
jgi:hypothetical protein